MKHCTEFTRIQGGICIDHCDRMKIRKSELRAVGLIVIESKNGASQG